MFGAQMAENACFVQQLNEEAANFDWTKSRGHTLSGGAHFEQYDEEFEPSSNVTSSQKVGGQVSVLPTARAASVNAAFARLASTSTPLSGSSGVHEMSLRFCLDIDCQIKKEISHNR